MGAIKLPLHFNGQDRCGRGHAVKYELPAVAVQQILLNIPLFPSRMSDTNLVGSLEKLLRSPVLRPLRAWENMPISKRPWLRTREDPWRPNAGGGAMTSSHAMVHSCHN